MQVIINNKQDESSEFTSVQLIIVVDHGGSLF
jgi:hypothetical protein